jgi:hypothetical protein
MFKKNLYTAVFLSLFLFVSIGCKKTSNGDFSTEEKVLYDSLKIIAFKDVRSQTDIICGRAKDSLFNTYVDSLLNLRRAEIEQLFAE